MFPKSMYLVLIVSALTAGCSALSVFKPVSHNSSFVQSNFTKHHEVLPAHKYATLFAVDELKAVKAHAGIYKEKKTHEEFSNTVLVTAANDAYYEVFRNWQCYADRLHLDYVVIALDSKIYKKIGPELAILVNGTFVENRSNWREPGFNILSSNKIKMVQEITQETGLDVVFSDPDNIFVKDPFAHGDDLGDKIRSRKFQYIYQPNYFDRPNQGDIGIEVEEANTGFYFVSGSQKQTGIQHLFAGALDECMHNQTIDDQTNFWNALRNIREGKAVEKYGQGNFACCNFCGKGAMCNVTGEQVFDYCEMDPLAHATGWNSLVNLDEGMSTYHANYVYGLEGKIAKMRKMGLWGQCQKERGGSHGERVAMTLGKANNETKT